MATPPTLDSTGDGVLRLEYETTDADLEAFYRHATETHPIWVKAKKKLNETRKGVLFTMWTGAAAFALLLAGHTFGFHHPSLTTFMLVGVVFAVSLYMARMSSKSRMRRAIDKHIATMMADPSVECYVGPHVFVASEGGLFYRHPAGDISRGWPMVAWVERAPGFVGVHSGDGRCMFIPNRFLGADVEAVVTRLRGWLSAAESGDQQRIRTHLASNNAACPGCTYQLRGSEGGTCPECGLWLHRWNMPAAFKRASAAGATAR